MLLDFDSSWSHATCFFDVVQKLFVAVDLFLKNAVNAKINFRRLPDFFVCPEPDESEARTFPFFCLHLDHLFAPVSRSQSHSPRIVVAAAASANATCLSATFGPALGAS